MKTPKQNDLYHALLNLKSNNSYELSVELRERLIEHITPAGVVKARSLNHQPKRILDMHEGIYSLRNYVGAYCLVNNNFMYIVGATFAVEVPSTYSNGIYSIDTKTFYPVDDPNRPAVRELLELYERLKRMHSPLDAKLSEAVGDCITMYDLLQDYTVYTSYAQVRHVGRKDSYREREVYQIMGGVYLPLDTLNRVATLEATVSRSTTRGMVIVNDESTGVMATITAYDEVRGDKKFTLPIVKQGLHNIVWEND